MNTEQQDALFNSPEKLLQLIVAAEGGKGGNGGGGGEGGGSGSGSGGGSGSGVAGEAEVELEVEPVRNGYRGGGAMSGAAAAQVVPKLA